MRGASNVGYLSGEINEAGKAEDEVDGDEGILRYQYTEFRGIEVIVLA